MKSFIFGLALLGSLLPPVELIKPIQLDIEWARGQCDDPVIINEADRYQRISKRFDKQIHIQNRSKSTCYIGIAGDHEPNERNSIIVMPGQVFLFDKNNGSYDLVATCRESRAVMCRKID